MEDGVGALTWRLVLATRARDGRLLHPRVAGHATLVTYRLAVTLKIPMIGMLKRKAEKAIIDTALKELKKRVEG